MCTQLGPGCSSEWGGGERMSLCDALIKLTNNYNVSPVLSATEVKKP